MNKRIRELAEQANGPNPFYGTLKNQMTLLGDDAVEKFAELIVEECAKVCESMPLLGPYKEVQDATLKDAAVQIQEHFGVEE